MPADGLPSEIRNYYDAGLEGARLGEGTGPLEKARTQELVLRALPPPPARVLDVGGGPGAYAAWLAGLGYSVHLVDPVPGQVEEARRRAGPSLSAEVGDARALAEPDGSAEAVLLLGPLYHLTERSDRVRALAEARRVLRHGGVVLAAAISRFASLMAGLFQGLVDDPAFQVILDGDLADGQHRNPTGRLEYFTTSFFHRPEELAGEALEAGLEAASVRAIEGPAWLVPDFAARWEDEEKRAQLLEWVRRVEAEPALLGMSAHLMLTARRPLS